MTCSFFSFLLAEHRKARLSCALLGHTHLHSVSRVAIKRAALVFTLWNITFSYLQPCIHPLVLFLVIHHQGFYICYEGSPQMCISRCPHDPVNSHEMCCVCENYSAPPPQLFQQVSLGKEMAVLHNWNFTKEIFLKFPSEEMDGQWGRGLIISWDKSACLSNGESPLPSVFLGGSCLMQHQPCNWKSEMRCHSSIKSWVESCMPPKWNFRYTTSRVWASNGSLSLIFTLQNAAAALLLMFYLLQWGWGNPFSLQDAIRQFWNFFANVLKCSYYPAHSGLFFSLVYCCLLFIYELNDSCD